MSKALLHIKDAGIGYSNGNYNKALLKNIDAEVSKGAFLVLVGANGSGKSTLLRSIAGILPVLSGKLELEGRPLREIPSIDRAKLVSMVFANAVSSSGLSGYELVALGRQPYTGIFGKLKREDHLAIEQAMNQTQTSHLSKRSLFEMSDGEQQKLMIARALAQDTPLILLDEPTAFLDIGSRVEILSLLRSLSKDQNRTIIFSSHDVQLAFQICDLVWLIDKNGNLHCGSAKAIMQMPEWNEVLKERAKMDKDNFQIIL